MCNLAAGESSPSIRSLLEEANLHLRQGEVKQYEQTLRRAWQVKGDVADRVEAGTALADDLWYIRHKFGQAREVLAAARALDTKSVIPLIELAKLETFAGNYAAACEAGRAALSATTNKLEMLAAHTLFGHAVCDEVLRATLRAGRTGTNAETEARIHEAFELLEPVMQNEPGWHEPSRCQILLALLLGNGPGALRAWQSYYLLVPGAADAPPHLESPRDFGDLGFADGKWINRPLSFTEPGEILAHLLPAFTSESDTATRVKVVRALAGGRLFPEAAALALRWNLESDKTIRDIIIYGRWSDHLARLFAQAYRRHALGRSYWIRLYIPHVLNACLGRSSLNKILVSETKRLWQERHPDATASFREDSSAADLKRSFGAIANDAEDPDTFGYGHIVLATDETIEQDGHKKVMKCVVLDSMLCNSYADWLTGILGSGLAGWANPPDNFVAIRTEFSLGVWEYITDPMTYRRNIQERQASLNAADDERAKTNPCGYFPGLAMRLFVRGNERLLQRLKDQGLGGTELRTAFLKEHQRLIYASSILAHEGRHVLDPRDDGADREFRAKCSEIVFSPDPLVALSPGNIFSPNIGQQGSAHGTADALIMKNLLAWMKAHAREIAALDMSRPLLPQFDRLTDEQMREAFRSMDPWAKTH